MKQSDALIGETVQVLKSVSGAYAGGFGVLQRIENAHYSVDAFAVIEFLDGERLAFNFSEITQTGSIS